MLEYLATLYAGHTRPCSTREMQAYAKRFLAKYGYSDDTIRILHRAFRHSVAHRGIASGVWIDEHANQSERRITWRIGADCRSPAFRVEEQKGILRFDSPWECRYTHRAHISLGRLWRDIYNSALDDDGYCSVLRTNAGLQDKFRDCMKDLYPN